MVLLTGVTDRAFRPDNSGFATAVARDRGFRTTILVPLLSLLVGVRARVAPASTPTTTATANTAAIASTSASASASTSTARRDKTPLLLQSIPLPEQLLTSFCVLVRSMHFTAIGAIVICARIGYVRWLRIFMDGRFGGDVCYFPMWGIFGVGMFNDGGRFHKQCRLESTNVCVLRITEVKHFKGRDSSSICCCQKCFNVKLFLILESFRDIEIVLYYSPLGNHNLLPPIIICNGID